jgi:hypothetical protein
MVWWDVVLPLGSLDGEMLLVLVVTGIIALLLPSVRLLLPPSFIHGLITLCISSDL